MNGNEEHISWQRMHLTPEPPGDVPPVEPVPEVVPVAEVRPLEEVNTPDIYQLMPLEEVEPPRTVPAEMLLPSIPVAELVEEPPYARPVERPLAARPKAGLNSTLVSSILAWGVIVPIVLIVIVANHVLPDLRGLVKSKDEEIPEEYDP